MPGHIDEMGHEGSNELERVGWLRSPWPDTVRVAAWRRGLARKVRSLDGEVCGSHRRACCFPAYLDERPSRDRHVVKRVGGAGDGGGCPGHMRGRMALEDETHLPRPPDAEELTAGVRPQVKLMAGQGEPSSDNRGRSGHGIESRVPGDILPLCGLGLALDAPA